MKDVFRLAVSLFETWSVLYLQEEGTIQPEAIEISRLALEQRRICGALHR